MFCHRKAIFESKRDKLSSYAECRIQNCRRHPNASRLNAHSQTDWVIEDQAKVELDSPSPWWASKCHFICVFKICMYWAVWYGGTYLFFDYYVLFVIIMIIINIVIIIKYFNIVLNFADSILNRMRWVLIMRLWVDARSFVEAPTRDECIDPSRTSLHGAAFGTTGPLWGESLDDRWIPLTKAQL